MFEGDGAAGFLSSTLNWMSWITAVRNGLGCEKDAIDVPQSPTSRHDCCWALATMLMSFGFNFL